MICDGNFYTSDDVTRLLQFAINAGASEIHVNEFDFVKVEIQGRFKVFSDHVLDEYEVSNICDVLYQGDTGTAIVNSGIELDHEYEIKIKKDGDSIRKSFRFRVNSACATSGSSFNPSITIRILNDGAPDWDEMGYEEELYQAMRPKNGLIVVSGATGSGKTTLLAAYIKRILQTRDNEKVVMIESPIEYNQKPYQTDTTIVVQRAVGRDTKTFSSGLRASLRQHPTIIVVGESRDAETIETSLNGCQTGHLVATTTHSNSAAEIIPRMLDEFPSSERQSKLSSLVYNLRVIINQELALSEDGGRVAIREYLIVTPEIRDILDATPYLDIKKTVRRLINEEGRSAYKHALEYYQKGLLKKEFLDRLYVDNMRELDG
ncbi:type IV pilus twitching motility protein PilT [Photobacterium damselae]|uniref:type IV pilus twitching motility protein PilT n=1 Tax=Photobacterium damselae TaxID=38293 RepID=UPI001F48191B|nr:ATPase, T2SS/T4P/T4SS family [Photobacterium damselae]UKA04699.1 Flp pilus assembly complex ATPase component TadA [Photobacterium damselae subsp. damselae]